MPNKPITLRRWEVGAAILVYLAILAGTLTYMQHSIDEAEARITRNTESIARARARAEVAQEQAVHAKGVAAAQHKTIDILCGEIKAIKAQIVQTLTASAGSAQTFVGRLPGYTQADADLAEQRLHAALKRFAPRPCPPKEMPHG